MKDVDTLNVREPDEGVEVLLKRKVGRPSKADAEEKMAKMREARLPLGGMRSILAIEGEDPNYHYHWAVDDNENGNQIKRLVAAGYEFVSHTEGIRVGEAQVFRTEGLGSLLRVPAGDGRYHFLMRIPNEFYEDDQKRNAEQVNMTEQSITQARGSDGEYGTVKINR